MEHSTISSLPRPASSSPRSLWVTKCRPASSPAVYMIRAGRKPCRPRYSSRREDWPSALAHLPASNPAIAWAIWPRTRLGLENKNRNSNYHPRRLDMKKMIITGLVSLFAAANGAFTAPANAQSKETLRFVPQSDLKVLDPLYTTNYVTRNFGYMVYDTLFEREAKGVQKPKMVRSEEHTVELQSQMRN